MFIRQTSEQMWKFNATKPALYKNSDHRNSNGGREIINLGPTYTMIKYAAVKANVGQYADISGQSATRSSNTHAPLTTDWTNQMDNYLTGYKKYNTLKRKMHVIKSATHCSKNKF